MPRLAFGALIVVATLGCADQPVNRHVPYQWRPVVRAYQQYAMGNCEAVHAAVAECKYCSREGSVFYAHAHLIAAFCEERTGNREGAELSYRALAEAFPNTGIAKQAHLRLRHLDLPRDVHNPGDPPPPKVRPLVRVPPEYPQLAAHARLTGWVLLQHDITASGEVTGIRVLDSDPPYLFEQAAVTAAAQFLFEPVAVTGAQIVLSFDGGGPR